MVSVIVEHERYVRVIVFLLVVIGIVISRFFFAIIIPSIL